MGCSGETTVTFNQGGRCSYGAFGSQLQAAVAFLSTHRGSVKLVTINLGGNDVGPCSGAGGIDTTCLNNAETQVRTNLSIAMLALRVAAGSRVPIIGMNFYQPLLVLWLFGPDGQAIANASLAPLRDLNDMMEQIYGSVGGMTADVETAYDTFQTTPTVSLPGFGDVPFNVARICQLLWICSPPPFFGNAHPNDEGYRVIADAFAAKL